MAIEKIDQERCIGCGLCFNVCFADVIRMDTDIKKAALKYPEDCAACCWCVALCPKDAIVFTPVKTAPVFTSWG